MQKSMAESLAGDIQDILQEIFKHLDAESVGRVSCVNRRWRQAAYNENLWEIICTRRWPAEALYVSAERLRAVVVALGGFRRLYINCVHPLLARRGPSMLNSNNNLAPQCLWSEDEIHLSLSLFSIDYYERLDPLTSCYNGAGSSLDILTCSPRSAQSGGPDIRKLLPGRTACSKRKQPHGHPEVIAGSELIKSRSMKRTGSKSS